MDELLECNFLFTKINYLQTDDELIINHRHNFVVRNGKIIESLFLCFE